MRHRAIGIGDDCQAIYMPEIDCGGGCGDMLDRIIELQNAVDNLDYRLDNAEGDIDDLEGDVSGLDGRLDALELLTEDMGVIPIGASDHEGGGSLVEVIGKEVGR